jgi:hypothetical protein
MPIVTRNRFPLQGLKIRKPGALAQIRNYQDYSNAWGNRCRDGGSHLQKSSRPFKTGHPERWPSGLRRTLGKRVCGKPYRGFESHSLRHYTVLLCIRLFESIAKTTSGAIKAVAVNSAMLPPVTAQTVAFDRRFGGRISRGGTHGRQAQAAGCRTRKSARQIC